MMVTINIDLKDVYSTMSEDSILAGRRALSNQALADMNENFVPMRDGWLRNSAILALDGSEIIWTRRMRVRSIMAERVMSRSRATPRRELVHIGI